MILVCGGGGGRRCNNNGKKNNTNDQLSTSITKQLANMPESILSARQAG
jgi:hypothetical protein